jgi:hypothetical protein
MEARLGTLPGGGPGSPTFTLPEAQALQQRISAKASTAQIKAALEKCLAARSARQAQLQKARDDLRKVLTTRQEAIATLYGLL